jgi:hypothetical protein
MASHPNRLPPANRPQQSTNITLPSLAELRQQAPVLQRRIRVGDLLNSGRHRDQASPPSFSRTVDRPRKTPETNYGSSSPLRGFASQLDSQSFSTSSSTPSFVPVRLPSSRSIAPRPPGSGAPITPRSHAHDSIDIEALHGVMSDSSDLEILEIDTQESGSGNGTETDGTLGEISSSDESQEAILLDRAGPPIVTLYRASASPSHSVLRIRRPLPRPAPNPRPVADPRGQLVEPVRRSSMSAAQRGIGTSGETSHVRRRSSIARISSDSSSAGPSTKRRRTSTNTIPTSTPHLRKAPAFNAAKSIEQIDLSQDSDPDTAALTSTLQKQRADAISSQFNNDNGGEKSKLNTLQCTVCLDTPTDLTATSCGHTFCYACLMDWLVAAEKEAGGGPGGRRSNCPACRKPISRNKKGDVVPLEIKLIRGRPR